MYHLLESLELKVELPMLLDMDNSRGVNIVNSWIFKGRTRQVDVQNYFLRELKDQVLLTIRYIPGDDKNSNIFTKNLTAVVFNHHIPHYLGLDDYVQVQGQALSGEAV
jgi:hypothetical protein